MIDIETRLNYIKKVVTKVLSIIQAFYSRYSLFFLFNNAINYSIYSKNIFQIRDINKNLKKKQLILYNSWFNYKNIYIN